MLEAPLGAVGRAGAAILRYAIWLVAPCCYSFVIVCLCLSSIYLVWFTIYYLFGFIIIIVIIKPHYNSNNNNNSNNNSSSNNNNNISGFIYNLFVEYLSPLGAAGRPGAANII